VSKIFQNTAVITAGIFSRIWRRRWLHSRTGSNKTLLVPPKPITTCSCENFSKFTSHWINM